MADGNFHRSMLPSDSYRSGLRAGEARMRTRATQLLEILLSSSNLQITPEEHSRLLQEFHKRLLH